MTGRSLRGIPQMRNQEIDLLSGVASFSIENANTTVSAGIFESAHQGLNYSV